MGSMDSFTGGATNLFPRVAIIFVTRCSFCIRTGRIPARSPRPLYGSPAPVKVVRKNVSGAARRWFGLRLHR